MIDASPLSPDRDRAPRRPHPDAGARARDHAERGSVHGDLAVALGTGALGAFLLIGASGIRAGSGYDHIGPRFFPLAVAAGLIVFGGVLAALSVMRRSAQPAAVPGEPLPPVNWRSLVWLAAALLIGLVLLDPAGFVVASSLQFWLVAHAFHSRRPARDGIAAVVVSAVVYVLFSTGLGLTLPPGILAGVL